MNTAQNTPDPALRRRRRGTLILLAFIFLAPVAFAFYLYYGSGGWRPHKNVNRGELLSPARPLPELALPTPEGTATDPAFLRGKWTLIYVDRLEDGVCDTRCREALYQIRQVRLTFNEKSDRIQRVLLHSGSCCEQPFFSAEHPGLIVANVDSAQGQQLLQQFSLAPGESPLKQGRIYISDPLGNLMMSYAPSAKPNDFRDDLKRLLKLSHIG